MPRERGNVCEERPHRSLLNYSNLCRARRDACEDDETSRLPQDQPDTSSRRRDDTTLPVRARNHRRILKTREGLFDRCPSTRWAREKQGARFLGCKPWRPPFVLPVEERSSGFSWPPRSATNTEGIVPGDVRRGLHGVTR